MIAHRSDVRVGSTTKDRPLSGLFLGLKTEESRTNDVDLMVPGRPAPPARHTALPGCDWPGVAC